MSDSLDSQKSIVFVSYSHKDGAQRLVKQTEKPFDPHVPDQEDWAPPEYLGVLNERDIVGHHSATVESVAFEPTRKRRCIWVLIWGLILTTANCGRAAEIPNVPIGTKIKSLSFKDIRYLPRTLNELGKRKAFVFAFTNTSCPLVQKYWPRLKRLHAAYKPKGVEVVSINVGVNDTIREVASQSIEYGLLFPNVKDVTGACVRTLGVHRTPEVVVLDADHRLVYRGRIDDQYRLGGTLPMPRRNDLRAALDNLLAPKQAWV